MRPSRWFVRGFFGTALCVLAVALWVRGYDLEHGPHAPRSAAKLEVPEPMELLGPRARSRIDLRWQWIDEERQELWDAWWEVPFEIQDCPPLSEWLETEAGLGFIELVRALEEGDAEEGLTSLALHFQLARTVHWRPTLLGDASDAKCLADLLARWLELWADVGAKDPLLEEPLIAAIDLYARAMDGVVRAPLFGRDEVAFERARIFLVELTGAGELHRTRIGERLSNRQARAFEALPGEDGIALLAAESEFSFPGLDGECRR